MKVSKRNKNKFLGPITSSF